MNADKKEMVFICVHPCPSVANSFFEEDSTVSAGYGEGKFGIAGAAGLEDKHMSHDGRR
jgi:hypothetical protein